MKSFFAKNSKQEKEACCQLKIFCGHGDKQSTSHQCKGACPGRKDGSIELFIGIPTAVTDVYNIEAAMAELDLKLVMQNLLESERQTSKQTLHSCFCPRTREAGIFLSKF